MPELPEVETTKASLTPLINHTVSKVETHQPKLRWPIPDNLSELIGYKLIAVKRRAKYLILTFQAPTTCVSTQSINQTTEKGTDPKLNEKKLIIHLGMSGSLQQHSIGFDKRKHDHLIMTFAADSKSENETYQLHYHDPRRFGAVLWYDDYADKLLPHLGVEPLEDSFNVEYLYKRIWRIADDKNNDQTAQSVNSDKAPAKVSNKSSAKAYSKVKQPIKRPIKSVIMDQAFVVGVGNIYATESLFLSGIHPLTPANKLDKKALGLLVAHIKAVLKKSIEKGGSTLKDFTVADGQTGYFQQTLNVYGRHKAPCPICSASIEKVVITGRASTFCPNCQPI